MSIVDIITLGIFLVSVLTLIVVIARKYHALRTIDVLAIHEHRTAQLKGDIIANRLSRKFSSLWRRVITVAGPVRQRVQKFSTDIVEKVETLEREYRVKSILRQSTPHPESLARLQALLAEAEQLLKNGEIEKAEQKYIEVISLHPRTGQAFQGLGEVYLAKKDYDHAKASLRHAIKLSPRLTSLYLNLAEVYQRTGQPAKAIEQCRMAVSLEPNDPKNLDALLAASIAARNHELALRTFRQLESANPENQKLGELREQVELLIKR